MTDYCLPASPEEAISLLARHEGQALIIAGGTDLLPDMRKGKRAPRCLVDITRIRELQRIEVSQGQVQVGAAVTFAELAAHPYLQAHVHALVDAARSVGAVAIQSSATWAGNIVQAMPAADGAIVALALEAEARILDMEGTCWRPVAALFAGPGCSVIDPARQLLTHLRFALPTAPYGTAWQRIGRRASLALPILNCAARIVLAGERIASATLALGPVAPCPWRACQAEAFLAGRLPGAEVFAEAVRIAGGESDPRSSVMRASREYRLAVLPAVVADALSLAARRARVE